MCLTHVVLVAMSDTRETKSGTKEEVIVVLHVTSITAYLIHVVLVAAGRYGLVRDTRGTKSDTNPPWFFFYHNQNGISDTKGTKSVTKVIVVLLMTKIVSLEAGTKVIMAVLHLGSSQDQRQNSFLIQREHSLTPDRCDSSHD